MITDFTDRNAEMSVIGSVLMDQESVLQEAVAELTPEMFFFEDLREIFSAMVQLARRGDYVDTITVPPLCANPTRALSLMAQAVTATPTSVHYAAYINRVKDLAARRQVNHIVTDALKELTSTPAQEVLPSLMRKLQTVATPVRVADADELTNHVEDVVMGRSAFAKPTGFKVWDELLGGLLPALYVVTGVTSAGKTTLAVQLALAVAEQGPVSVLSLEMTPEQLRYRYAVSRAGLDMRKVLRVGMTNSERQKVLDANRAIGNLPIRFVYSTNNAEEIAGAIVAEARNGSKLVVIDGLWQMKAPGRSRYEQISNAVLTVQASTKQAGSHGLPGIPVVLIHQLNRAAQRSGPHGTVVRPPRLADLADSGTVEQTADYVVALHRPGAYDENLSDYEARQVTLYCLKDRLTNMAPSSTHAAWDKETGRLVPVTVVEVELN